MGRFNQERGRGSDRFSGRRSDKPQMHDATCAQCGRSCQVPFRPTGDKPVYCSSCFEKQEDGGNSFRRNDRGGDRGSFRRDSSRDKEMFSVICDECGKKCEVPFKPSSDKPIYCSECFKKHDSKGDRSPRGNSEDISQLKTQLDNICVKLDRIIQLLAPVPEKKVAVKKEVVKKVAKKKVTTKKE